MVSSSNKGFLVYYYNYYSNSIYSCLEEDSTNQFNELSSNSQKVYLSIEIMGFIIIVFFFYNSFDIFTSDKYSYF